MKNKQQIRAHIRNTRRQLSSHTQEMASHALVNHLVCHDIIRKHQHFALYLSHDGEINPYLLRKTIQDLNKYCYLPIIDRTSPRLLHFAQYHEGDQLIKNRFGIGEPCAQSATMISTKQLDVVFLPLVAFDQCGYRIGMGAGYYDHTFQFTQQHPKPLLYGLAFEFQQFSRLDPDPWDIPLSGIITEKNIYLMEDKNK